MRTSNMIYQAAVAHQTELRRTASRHSATTARSSGRASWILRVAQASSQQLRSASRRTPVFTRSVSI